MGKCDMNILLRIANIIIGCLLVALAVVRFVYAGDLNFLQILITVYYL